MRAGHNKTWLAHENEPWAQGWLLSIVLHAIVILPALIVVKRIPSSESFTWNVSIVNPSELDQVALPSDQEVSPLAEPVLQQSTSSSRESTMTPIAPAPPGLPMPPIAPSSATSQITRPTEAVSAQNSATADVYKIIEADGSISFSNVPNDPRYHKMTGGGARIGRVERFYDSSSNGSSYTDPWLFHAIQCGVKAHLAQMSEVYPSDPTNQTRAQVVMQFTLHEDGSISDLTLYKSSGHPLLDSDAMRLVGRSAPFVLPRPLGKPSMIITYGLRYLSPTSHGYTRLHNAPPDC